MKGVKIEPKIVMWFIVVWKRIMEVSSGMELDLSNTDFYRNRGLTLYIKYKRRIWIRGIWGIYISYKRVGEGKYSVISPSLSFSGAGSGKSFVCIQSH